MSLFRFLVVQSDGKVLSEIDRDARGSNTGRPAEEPAAPVSEKAEDISGDVDRSIGEIVVTDEDGNEVSIIPIIPDLN